MTYIYPVKYLYLGKESSLLWMSCPGGEDTYLLDKAGNVLKHESYDELRLYAESAGLLNSIDWSDDSFFDMDQFVKTLKELKPWEAIPKEDCNLILDSWNFIEDILRTIGDTDDSGALFQPEMNLLYEHMYAGSNIPAVTPSDKSYHPVLSDESVTTLKTTLLSVLRKLENVGAL